MLWFHAAVVWFVVTISAWQRPSLAICFCGWGGPGLVQGPAWTSMVPNMVAFFRSFVLG